MSSQQIALDSPEFVGRLRDYSRRSTYERRPIIISPRPGQISDILASRPAATKLAPAVQPPKALYVQDLGRPAKHRPVANHQRAASPRLSHARWFKTNVMLTGMVAALFLMGAGVAILQLRTNSHVAAQVQQVVNSVSSDSTDTDANSSAPPDETKPNNLGSYVAPPTQPRYISIPKLDVFARVRKLGVKTNNELMTPNNVYDTGWYEDSAKPGDAGGAILIDGHVHGPTTPGVFYGLKTLKPGDSIQIERGDGQKFDFRVVRLQSYDVDKVDMAAALTPIVPGKLGLNIITCTGQLDDTGNHYEQRLIVFAVAE